MGGAIARGSFDSGLASALDRAQGDAHLCVPVRRGEFLHGLALPIAAEEVHAPIRARRIALQHMLDQTDRLDVLPPIERREEPQAGDGIRHRHLVGRLPLMLAANRRFGRCVLRGEAFLDGRADRRQAEAVLADAMQQLDD